MTYVTPGIVLIVPHENGAINTARQEPVRIWKEFYISCLTFVYDIFGNPFKSAHFPNNQVAVNVACRQDSFFLIRGQSPKLIFSSNGLCDLVRSNVPHIN